ncbi:hypothetical protein DXC89_07760, partial [Prevotella disiens]
YDIKKIMFIKKINQVLIIKKIMFIKKINQVLITLYNYEYNRKLSTRRNYVATKCKRNANV